MRRSKAIRGVALGTALLLFAAGCSALGGSGKADAPADEVLPVAGDDSGATTGSATGSPITDISKVQSGVVQIIARGTFRDPEVGEMGGAGSGSGFLISPDGLAVTNNHVVTGAATLEVYVGGDTTKSYNAQVLGVSECNDLALIKLSGVSDLPYFDWYEGDIAAGMDVYAAGFPLGDPEFTLTRGIVAKARAAGDLTGTSSVDHTIEHDATIHPGNSGGPLVTPDGKVVGINYAGGNLGGSTSQYFAIAADLARPVVERLRDGNFESLGINGWAIYEYGIWVAGVAPGSPASNAGIQAGDIIWKMNGLPMGLDGRMTDYCSVLRTSGETAPIAVEVMRYDTSEMLRGELRSGARLEVTESWANRIAGEGGSVQASGTAYTYQGIVDDTGTLAVELPAQWGDIDTTPAMDGDTVIPYIGAATSLASFRGDWTAPGLHMFQFPRGSSVNDALEAFSFAGSCTNGGVNDYDDGLYQGKWQLWTDCPSGATIVSLAVAPASGNFLIVLQAQILSEADVDALDHAFNTFISNDN